MLHKGKAMTRGSYYFDRNGNRIYIHPINHRFYDNVEKTAKDSQRLQTRQLGKCEADYQGQGFGKNL